jgi:thiol-disulfide isomerase/thioredoxin
VAKPVVDGLERDLGKRMRVAHVDVNSDDGQRLAQRHRIRGVPAFLMFDARGEVVYRQLGGRPDVAEVTRLLEAAEARAAAR